MSLSSCFVPSYTFFSSALVPSATPPAPPAGSVDSSEVQMLTVESQFQWSLSLDICRTWTYLLKSAQRAFQASSFRICVLEGCNVMIEALESLTVSRPTHIGQRHALKLLTTEIDVYNGVSNPENAEKLG